MHKLSDWDYLSIAWNENKRLAVIMLILYVGFKLIPWVLLLGFITLAAYIIKSI